MVEMPPGRDTEGELLGREAPEARAASSPRPVAAETAPLGTAETRVAGPAKPRSARGRRPARALPPAPPPAPGFPLAPRRPGGQGAGASRWPRPTETRGRLSRDVPALHRAPLGEHGGPMPPARPLAGRGHQAQLQPGCRARREMHARLGSSLRGGSAFRLAAHGVEPGRWPRRAPPGPARRGLGHQASRRRLTCPGGAWWPAPCAAPR